LSRVDAASLPDGGRSGYLSGRTEVDPMSYYQKILQPDETVKYVGKLHWIIYKHSILLGILAVVLAVVSLNLAEDWKLAVLAGSGVLAVLAILAFLRSWFVQWTTETVVTDKRIIHKLGFIARHTQEMNITKVETVDVMQSFWGRILGYGIVRAIGTGATWETLRPVASPLQLRNAITIG
jgi:uncharacterized membrane protein YdbT with pleckstrin-like domain